VIKRNNNSHQTEVAGNLKKFNAFFPDITSERTSILRCLESSLDNDSVMAIVALVPKEMYKYLNKMFIFIKIIYIFLETNEIKLTCTK